MSRVGYFRRCPRAWFWWLTGIDSWTRKLEQQIVTMTESHQAPDFFIDWIARVDKHATLFWSRPHNQSNWFGQYQKLMHNPHQNGYATIYLIIQFSMENLLLNVCLCWTWCGWQEHNWKRGLLLPLEGISTHFRSSIIQQRSRAKRADISSTQQSECVRVSLRVWVCVGKQARVCVCVCARACVCGEGELEAPSWSIRSDVKSKAIDEATHILNLLPLPVGPGEFPCYSWRNRGCLNFLGRGRSLISVRAGEIRNTNAFLWLLPDRPKINQRSIYNGSIDSSENSLQILTVFYLDHDVSKKSLTD